MKQVTAKLLTAALARADDLPTMAARDVFFALLDYALRRERVPTMAELAKRRNMGEERLSTALLLLRDYRLVDVVPDPLDARRRIPQLNVALVCEWAAGDYVLASAGNGRPVDWGDTPENAGHITPAGAEYSKAETPENAGHPRARASTSFSSSSSLASSVAADVAAAREFEDHHKRAVQAFRDCGVGMPRKAQLLLWEYMRRGIQFEDAEEVAEACMGVGTTGWNYAKKCFEGRLRERIDGRARDLLRGWEHEPETPGTAPAQRGES